MKLSTILWGTALATSAPFTALAQEAEVSAPAPSPPPVEVHAYVQAWWLGAGAAGSSDAIVRHAVLEASAARGPWSLGVLLDAAAVTAAGPSRLTGEPAGEPIAVVSDAVVSWEREGMTIAGGHAGLPVGTDGPRPHTEQWFADRSAIGQALGELADLGVWVGYERGRLSTFGGVYGGEGLEAPGREPRVAGRIALAGEVTLGATGVVGVGGRGDWVAGLDAALDGERVDATAQVYAGALPDGSGGVGPAVAGASIEVRGALGAFTPAARVEWFDGDTAMPGGAMVRGTACLGFQIPDQELTRLQLQVSTARLPRDQAASVIEGDHQVVLAAQVGM